MTKFIYISHLDKLKWILHPDTPIYEVDLDSDELDTSDDKRNKIYHWINDNCESTVYAWNRCRSVTQGETNWAKKVSPTGDITLIFLSNGDMANFILTWKEYKTTTMGSKY